jgi:Tol biopolymer transport system component
VGYFEDEKLKIVSLRGGDPVMLCDAGMHRGGSWSSDGMIYFANGKGLWRVPMNGGDTELLEIESTSLKGFYPQVLPGGKAVLISSKDGAVLVSLEKMKKKLLVKDVLYARYVPTGHLVYVRAGAIEAVPFNLATLEVTGNRVIVIEKVLSDSERGAAQFAFSNNNGNGLLVYVPGSDTAKSIPAWVDRQGNAKALDMSAEKYGALKLSPDGKQLAIVVKELQSNIYIYNVVRGTKIRLTKEGNNDSPLWTPDGKRIVFSHRSDAGGQWNLLSAPADGNGEAESLLCSEHELKPYSWLSEGKFLAFYENFPTTGWGILILPMEGGGEPELILKIDRGCWGPAFSPDGRHIAYTSVRDGSPQIYLQPYPKKDRIIPISRETGEEPVWSHSGDELFYRNRDKWMVVSITTKPEITVGKPQVVFKGPYINVGGLSYDVTPDDQRLLVLEPQYDDSQERELRVVTNWFEEIKQLVASSEAP